MFRSSSRIPVAKFLNRSIHSNGLIVQPKNAVQKQQKRRILFKMGNETPARVVGYYVVFPVIPEETVENNCFMYNIAKNEDWPKLATAEPKEMYEGTVRMLMDYGATVMEHMEHLATLPAEERKFETVVDPLLTEEYDVNMAFQTLVLKMLTDWPDCNRKLFDADLHHIKIMCARDQMEKLTNGDFQAAIKQLYEAKDGLSEWQSRLLEWYLLEIKASGLDKHDDKTRKILGSWSKFIDEYRSKYITGVMSTNDQQTFVVNDPKVIKDAPPHVLQKLAVDEQNWESGPWRGTMTPHTIYPFMQYCGDRQLRATAWEKWTSKAGFDHDFYNNSINIEELRHNNEGLAKTLGYSSVAEHRLANKMAASPDTVRGFIDALTRRIRPVVIDRMESWTAWAARCELITGELQAYDMPYVCRKEAEHHYERRPHLNAESCSPEKLERVSNHLSVNPLDLMNHFPFWPTFQNILGVVGHIFNLEFKDITDKGLERAHQDARIYSVGDKFSGKHYGRLYIDPFDRQNKRGGWNVMLGRPESKERGLDKIVYFIGSAIAPTANAPSLLHHQQLQQLLFHFGRSVQLLLSQSPYRDIAIPWSPFYASDWDAADMFPTFLQMFVTKPNLLAAISSPHLVTKNALSESEANSVALAISRASLWDTYRTLFWSDFDLTIYQMEDRKQKFWLDMYKQMYTEYFPFKRAKNDYQPCSFTPIFALQPHMSMYYRKLWAEMLALDIHETFDEEDNEVQTGERLKTTVLNRGSGDVAKELFRRFQGRNPSVGAICDYYAPPLTILEEETAENKRR